MKAGESQTAIKVGLKNDPTGVTRNFTVHLKSVEGRDKMGSKKLCKVKVANRACEYSLVFKLINELQIL